jgi:hypothetical protein
MLTDRIIGAFTFKKGVYSEVEHDASFTQTAWMLVAVVAFLNQLGSQAGLIATEGPLGWLIGVVVGTVFSVLGFALGAYVIAWLGKAMFKADVSFEEVVRTLGLAYVWNIIGVVGLLSALLPALVCLLAPVTFTAAIAGLVAWLIAVKEALDLEWMQTIIVVVIGWIVSFLVTAAAGIILGMLGFTAAGIGSLFSQG